MALILILDQWVDIFVIKVSISISSRHDIIVKKQLTPNDIQKNCDEILSNKDSYDYHIDGLIFTPTKIPVLGAYANKPVEVDNINSLSFL